MGWVGGAHRPGAAQRAIWAARALLYMYKIEFAGFAEEQIVEDELHFLFNIIHPGKAGIHGLQ